MKRKILCLILAAAMLLNTGATSAFATDGSASPAQEESATIDAGGDVGPACTCEAVEGEAHAEDCPQYIVPDEPEQPIEPEQPVEPEQSTEPEQPTEPEQSTDSEQSAEPICTCETKCAEDAINAECEVCVTDLAACEGESAVDPAVAGVQALIAALPDAEVLAVMSAEEQNQVYNALLAADEAYQALNEEQKGQLAEENAKLDALFAYFNNQNMAAPAADAVSYVEYSWNSGTSMLSSATQTTTDYIVVDATITAWGDGKTYVVNDTVTIGQRVTIEGSVSLILTDGCELTVNGGIEVLENETLTIYAQNGGSGKLTATAGGNAAGIGGTDNQTGGSVNIHGGTVTATASGKGSGIGGSSNGQLLGAGGTVNIYSGSVTATGLTGIGSGSTLMGGGTTNIYGGFVTAKSNNYDEGGAGIGGGGFGGANSNNMSINIYGGVVTAIGGEFVESAYREMSAGIGGGFGNHGGAVTISGGIVNAEAGNKADAIGNGENGSGVAVTRTGGMIFEKNSGKFYGTTFTLPVDYSTPAGKTLTIAAGQTLVIPAGRTLTVNGSLVNNGTIQNNGTLILGASASQVSGSGHMTFNKKEAGKLTLGDGIYRTASDGIFQTAVSGQTAVEGAFGYFEYVGEGHLTVNAADVDSHTFVCKDTGCPLYLSGVEMDHDMSGQVCTTCGYTFCDVWVGGVQVSGIPDAGGRIDVTSLVNDTSKVTGTVTYAPSTKTLTLNGASITAAQTPAGVDPVCGVYSRSDLNLVLAGENTIAASTTDYSNGVKADVMDLAISGGGSLKMNSCGYGINALTLTTDGVTMEIANSVYAISLNEDCIITDSTVSAIGSTRGISSTTGTIKIDNSSVYAQGKNNSFYGTSDGVSVSLVGGAHVKAEGVIGVQGGVTSDGNGYLRGISGNSFEYKEAGTLEYSGAYFEYVGEGHYTFSPVAGSETHAIICADTSCGLQLTNAAESHSWNATADGAACGVCKANAAASVTAGGTTAYYYGIDNAVANWTDGATLTLLADVTDLTGGITTTGKGLVLDLNGHTLASEISIEDTSELTIRDSNGSGCIEGTVYANAGVYSKSALRLESGTVKMVMANGDFTMTGGSIKNEDGDGLYSNGGNNNIVISGGEIYGGETGIWLTYSSNLTITGTAKITGANEYAIRNGSGVVISGTPTISGSQCEFSLGGKITLNTQNTQPASGKTWRVKIDTAKIADGVFAIPGEGVTLDPAWFTSAMTGYVVVKDGNTLKLAKGITEDMVTVTKSATYSGSQQNPAVTVTGTDGSVLTEGQHYAVGCKDNKGDWVFPTDADTYTVVITGMNDYVGEVEKTYTINPKSLEDATVTAPNQTYTGSKLTPAVAVTLTGYTITSDDYDVSYSPDTLTDAGSYTVTVTGKGNFTGEKTGIFTIDKAAALTFRGEMNVANKLEYSYTFDLSTIVPGNHGAWGSNPAVEYELNNMNITTEGYYDGNNHQASISGHVLTLPIREVDSDAETSIGTVTVIIKSQNYEDSTLEITVNSTNKETVEITGVTAKNGTYNGSTWQGYTGTPTSAFGATGYEITYTGRGSTSYDSAAAPTDAGDYTVTFKVPDSNPAYMGTGSLDFSIAPRPLSWNTGSVTVSQAYVPGKVDVENISLITNTSVTLSGVISTDDVNWKGAVQSAEFADDDIGENKTVTVTISGLILTGTDCGNYAAPAATFTITGAITEPKTNGSGMLGMLDGDLIISRDELPTDAGMDEVYGAAAATALRAKFGSTNVMESIQTALKEAATKTAGANASNMNHKVLEIFLEYYDATDQKWVRITENNLDDVKSKIPGGIPVTIPFDLLGSHINSSNYSSYDFLLHHMIALPLDHANVGDIERLTVTVDANGLHITVENGFSPFVISYAGKPTGSSGGSSSGSSGNSSSGNGSSGGSASAYKDGEYDFWMGVKAQIEAAKTAAVPVRTTDRNTEEEFSDSTSPATGDTDGETSEPEGEESTTEGAASKTEEMIQGETGKEETKEGCIWHLLMVLFMLACVFFIITGEKKPWKTVLIALGADAALTVIVVIAGNCSLDIPFAVGTLLVAGASIPVKHVILGKDLDRLDESR